MFAVWATHKCSEKAKRNFSRMSKISYMIQFNSKNLRTSLWLTASLVAFCAITTGCNQNRYQPADWAARKAALSTLPQNSSTTLPQHGSTLPRNGSTLPRGTTLPHGTTLPFSGSTLPQANSGTTLPTQLPDLNGTTLPRR